MSKILIAYASNSGSTFQAAEQLGRILGKKHKITLQKVEDVRLDNVSNFDGVILGTPSWAEEGYEGFPLPAMMKFLRAADGHDFSKLWFAFFGCGDSAYTHFCGAVDIMETFVSKFKSQSLVPPLKIDGYYFDRKNNEAKIESWAKTVLSSL